MLVFLSILILTPLSVYAFMQQPKFGKLPSGERLERVKQSPNYRNGSFQNLSHTPDLTEGVSYFKVMKQFFLEKNSRVEPLLHIPSTKTDLLNLDPAKDVLVWFGHSSYFMQIDGKRILVDPVLSGAASPVAFSIRAFNGSDAYTPADIPEIDYLFISHDHWDHLDYDTIKKLKPKIKTIICGLGIGEHFEYWGFDKKNIIERDWNEDILLDIGFSVHTVPARHFSGRGFTRNKALWTAFVLQTPSMKIFIGGDGGYDTHFTDIGNKFGEFDLAIIENGQYDWKWKYIHFMPGENVKAAKELKAKRVFPVHSSKFALANHAWDEPLRKFSEGSETEDFSVITPIIGEQVNLKDTTQQFKKWWTELS